MTQVAENVHISRARAYTRIARLTGEGVLTKFTALVDRIKAGLKSSAYVTLKVSQHSWRELREQLRAIPEVQHIASVGGDFDVILLVRYRQHRPPPGDLRPTAIYARCFGYSDVLVFEDVDTR